MPDGALPTIRVEYVRRSHDASVEGAVWYEISYPDGRYSYMRQPFCRGAGEDADGRPIWDWTGGDFSAPTLSPSFVCQYPDTKARVHLYMRAGAIDLLGDSTVRLP